MSAEESTVDWRAVANDLRRALEKRNAALAAERERVKALEADAARIGEVVAEGDGWWQSCSGCLECEDGHPIGDYPYSDAFKCQVGGGCGDCGGLGVTWHDARGLAEWCEEQAAEMSREAKAEARAIAAEAAAEQMRVTVSVQKMQCSNGDDFFVHFECAGRTGTPHRFKERWHAEYEAAFYHWLFNGGDQPNITDYSADGWPILAGAAKKAEET